MLNNFLTCESEQDNTAGIALFSPPDDSGDMALTAEHASVPLLPNWPHFLKGAAMVFVLGFWYSPAWAYECADTDWSVSFDTAGTSRCENVRYMTGMYKSYGSALYNLEKVNCCTIDSADAAAGQVTTTADWSMSFDVEGWSKCTDGAFLSGLTRSDGNSLFNIEGAQCGKPGNLPSSYQSCYEQTDSGFLDVNPTWWSCNQPGYYLAGLYRSGLGELLSNIEGLYCCKPHDVDCGTPANAGVEHDFTCTIQNCQETQSCSDGLVATNAGSMRTCMTDGYWAGTVLTCEAENPQIALNKTGTFANDGNEDGFADVGETINYSFEVINAGNVTLTGITVSDPMVAVSGELAYMDVGDIDSTTFTASYTITQVDIDAGSVSNTATADSANSEPVAGSAVTSLLTKKIFNSGFESAFSKEARSSGEFMTSQRHLTGSLVGDTQAHRPKPLGGADLP